MSDNVGFPLKSLQSVTGIPNFATETKKSISMDNQKFFLTLALLFLSILHLNADTTVVRQREGQKRNISLQRTRTVRPNGEFEFDSNPECYFQDGTLHFSFSRSEGMAKVTVTEAQTGKENRMSALTLYPFDTTVETRTFVPKFEWDPSLMQTYGTNSMSLLQSHAAGDAVLQRIDNNVIENCRQ